MARDVSIPKLGMTMTEANLVEWRVHEGQWVEKDQPVLSIETEKVTYDVGAVTAGIIHMVVPAGQKVPVGEVVGLLAETREEYASLSRTMAPAGTEMKKAAAVPAGAVAETPGVSGHDQGRLRISPVARALAGEHGLDTSLVAGTGPGGRIVREDVLRAIKEKRKAIAAVALSPHVVAPTPVPAVAPSAALAEATGIKKVKEVIPLKGTRKTIADNLWRSLQSTAQMTFSGEIDATELVRFRQALVNRQKAIGTRITYTDIFVMVAAQALRLHPIVNSSLVGDEIKVWESINIGVAVDIELEQMPGLIVPVVHDADKKSLVEIHNTLAALAQKAREHKLLPDDVVGSTFTISSTGGASGEGILEGGGGGFDTPILNLGESAILEVGAIVKKPVVKNDEIVIRPLLSYSFTVDHRVIDGVPANRFINTFRQFIEQPSLLLAH